MPSARYTYISGHDMSDLLDNVNEFTSKYPEYRLLQVVNMHVLGYAILTTD